MGSACVIMWSFLNCVESNHSLQITQSYLRGWSLGVLKQNNRMFTFLSNYCFIWWKPVNFEMTGKGWVIEESFLTDITGERFYFFVTRMNDCVSQQSVVCCETFIALMTSKWFVHIVCTLRSTFSGHCPTYRWSHQIFVSVRWFFILSQFWVTILTISFFDSLFDGKRLWVLLHVSITVIDVTEGHPTDMTFELLFTWFGKIWQTLN